MNLIDKFIKKEVDIQNDKFDIGKKAAIKVMEAIEVMEDLQKKMEVEMDFNSETMMSVQTRSIKQIGGCLRFYVSLKTGDIIACKTIPKAIAND